MTLTRTWNNTPISRRSSDGYVNATAMCKANDKRWANYWRTERAVEYAEALAAEAHIRVSELVQVTHGTETWIHPQIAVDLARWISAPFAVWMDGWFLEGTQPKSAPPQLTPAENAREVLALLEQTTSFFEKLGGIDERDQLLFKDLARNQVLKLEGGALPALRAADELTLSDAWLEVTGQALPRSKGPALGRLVAQMYREEHNADPPTRVQYVDGAPRQVKSYQRSWLLTAVQQLATITRKHFT